jgi:hypothetical protein
MTDVRPKAGESLVTWFSHHKATWIPAGLGILLAPLVAYLIPNTTDARLAFLVGALVAVTATCVGLTIKIAESQDRIEQSEDQITSQITQSEDQITSQITHSEDRIASQVGNLVILKGLAELPEPLRKGIEEIVAVGRSLEADSPFSRVASTSVSEAAGIVNDAARGVILTAPRLSRQLVACCEETENTIHAVSLLKQDYKWWNSVPGRLFFTSNVAAVKERGVSITRIFIDDESCPEEEVRNLINRHKQAQVVCYIVPTSANAVKKMDVTIFDESIAHELSLDPNGEPLHAAFYNMRQEGNEVKRIQLEFEELKGHAKKWTGKLDRSRPTVSGPSSGANP